MNEDTSIIFIVIAVVLGVLTLVGGITYAVDRGAIRDKEFSVACLEAGGTILYSQCVTGVEPRD